MRRSPYLLQHAHNPVEWNPGGPEAFEIARRETKPIFFPSNTAPVLVPIHGAPMLRGESIAARDEQAICELKVDRGGTADVDQLYMNAVQLITPQGG